MKSNRTQGSQPTRLIAAFAALLAGWLLLSGKFDVFHIAWGVFAALAVAIPACRWLGDRPFPLLRFLAFMPWELYQILVSNLRVARIVLSPGMPIRARLLRRPPGTEDSRALTVLGCAITLTPGTLTVDINESYMIVHALDDPSFEDMENRVMVDRVGKVFGGDGS